MDPVDQAVADFKNGMICSQAVLSAFAPRLGLDRTLALRLAAPFGGGTARLGLTCGAVTGAILAISMRPDAGDPADQASREQTYALVQELARKFIAVHGSVVCKDLLGLDLSRPDDHHRATELGLFKNRCPDFVRTSAQILSGLIQSPNSDLKIRAETRRRGDAEKK